jgi:uncharacterized coiled-coil protein SlyX
MEDQTTQTTTEGKVEGTTEATQVTEETKVATETESEAQGSQDQTKETKTEQPFTLSKVDFEKALEQAKTSVKGGYEGTVKKLKDDLAQVKQTYENTVAQVERERQENFLKSLETNGLDVNIGRQLVDRERKVSAQEKQLRDLSAQLAETQAELNQASFNKKVIDLAKQYNLSDEDAKALASAQNPFEMENIALKTALSRKAVATKKATVVAGDGTGKSSIDLSKLGTAEALGLAAEGKI